MPAHDWTRVDAGLFHDFHQSWVVALRSELNSGGLPPDYFALVEQSIGGPIPDVLTLKHASDLDEPMPGATALAVAEAPPQAQVIQRSEADVYAARASRVTVRHRHGEVVAVIEMVSPGNKASRAEFRAFLEKSVSLIRQGVHLLVVDLFPPGPRDPHGIHKAIWDEFEEEEFDLSPDMPLILAAYDAGPPRVAYVNSIAVGDRMPDMPIFLKPAYYVLAHLEAAYQTAWSAFPAALKGLLADPR